MRILAVFKARVTAIEPQITSRRAPFWYRRRSTIPTIAFAAMFANVSVIFPRRRRPFSCLRRGRLQPLWRFGFRRGEDGKDDKGQPVLKVTRVYVKTGDRFDGKVEILSGLKGMNVWPHPASCASTTVRR